MALSADIYRLFAPRTVNDYQAESQNLENARTAGEANQLSLLLKRDEMAERDRGRADANALRELQRSMAGTPEDQIPDAYMRAGRINEAMAARKTLLEQQKAAADAKRAAGKTPDIEAKTAQTNVETVGKVTEQFKNELVNVADPASAVRWLKAQYDHPILGEEMKRRGGDFMESAQRIPTEPAAFAKWRQMAGLGMEKFVADETQRRGQDTTAATSLATNEATNRRMAAEGAANRAVEMTKAGMTDRRAREANAIAAGELPSGAPALGVPVPTVVPWANQSNAKDANKVKAAEATRGAKEVEKDVENATKEGGVAAAAKRFLELNAKVKTGTVLDKTGPGRWVQSMGGDYAELEAITAKLVPGMREPGSGTTSDRDLAMFERSTVGVDKPQATNAAIANGIIARAQNSQDYALFRQTYLEQNGTLQGADRYWKQYLNANPIFDPKSETPKINAARKPWREHFAGGAAAAPTAPARAPTAPAGPPAAPGKVIDFSALPTGR